MIRYFSDFELDSELYQLRHNGTPLELEPKAFDLLEYLVRHKDRVVSKDELLEKVWSRAIVGESILPTHIYKLRRLLGDDRRQQKFLQTVYGRGYRFVAKLDEVRKNNETQVKPAPPSDAICFVGRVNELEEIEARLKLAGDGKGQFILLAGEPGIGKTSLIQKVSSVAEQTGFRVFTGVSYEADGTPAFWPWIQILRASFWARNEELLEEELGSGIVDIAQLLPELAEIINCEVLGSSSADADNSKSNQYQRFRLFDAIASYFRRAADTQALLIVVDDLHWADHTSLLLLHFLVRELTDMRVLIIGAYRDVDVRRDHPLRKILVELVRENRCQRLHLGRLGRGEVLHYLRSALPVTTQIESDSWVLDVLYRRSEGNPFFLSEIVALMQSERALACSTEKLSLFFCRVLPESIQDAIERRLDSLSRACKNLLSRAAILGVKFDLMLLGSLAETNRGEVLELLEEARQHGTVEPDMLVATRFSFSHTLIRETIYEGISPPLRIKLHFQAGEVLENLYRENLVPFLTELSYHFYQAAESGCVDKALEYKKEAAERAKSVAAWEDAITHYEQMLDIFDLALPGGVTEKCHVLMSLGDVCTKAGAREKARKYFVHAIEIARENSDRELFARAALGMAGTDEASPVPDEELRAILEQALQIIGSNDSAFRAVLLARLSMVYPYSTKRDSQLALTDEAVAVARRVGEDWALIQALIARASFISPIEDQSEKLAVGAELIKVAGSNQRAGNTGLAYYDSEWIGHHFRYVTLIAQSEIQEADNELVAMRCIAERQRQPIHRFSVLLAQFGRALAAARFDDAENLILQGKKIAKQLSPLQSYNSMLQEFLLARERGPEFLPDVMIDLGRSQESRLTTPFRLFGWREPFTDDVASSGVILESIHRETPWLARLVTAILAHSHMQLGRDREASEALKTLMNKDFEALKCDAEALFILGLSADVAAYLRDETIAERIFEQLKRYSGCNISHIGTHSYLGPVSYFLGILSGVFLKPEDAINYLEEALEMNVKMRSWAHVARTQLKLAHFLSKSGKKRQSIYFYSAGMECAKSLGIGTLIEQK